MVLKHGILFRGAILVLLSVAIAAQSVHENENLELSSLNKAKDEGAVVAPVTVRTCKRICSRDRRGRRYCWRDCSRRGRRDLSVQEKESEIDGMEFSSSSKAKAVDAIPAPRCQRICRVNRRTGRRVCRTRCL